MKPATRRQAGVVLAWLGQIALSVILWGAGFTVLVWLAAAPMLAVIEWVFLWILRVVVTLGVLAGLV